MPRAYKFVFQLVIYLLLISSLVYQGLKHKGRGLMYVNHAFSVSVNPGAPAEEQENGHELLRDGPPSQRRQQQEQQQPQQRGLQSAPPLARANAAAAQSPYAKRHRPGMDPNRVSTNPSTIVFVPRNFSLKGLPLATPNLKFPITDLDESINDVETVSLKLCGAAFQRDIAALKYLLYDVGVPPTLTVDADTGKSLFHCLAQSYGNTEKTSVLQNTGHRETWLHDYFDKHYLKNGKTRVYSVLMREIFESEENNVMKVAEWLLRANAPLNAREDGGYTPLHVASMGGLSKLADFLINNGAEVNAVAKDGRTPLHYACVYSHIEVAKLLMKADANMKVKDKYGVTPYDLVYNPGAVSPEQASKVFGVKQRTYKKINRVLHPELHAGTNYANENSTVGWKFGTGGWGTQRLKGYEKDMLCEGIDQYHITEIDGDTLFNQYIARNMPFMIRGAIEHWRGAGNLYKAKTLKDTLGNKEFDVSDVPYTQKFGNDAFVRLKLSEYVDQMLTGKVVGGKYPWYIFSGISVASQTELEDSPVKFTDCPTPHVIQSAFEKMVPDGYYGPKRGDYSVAARQHFISAQWALGGEGTGAPVHFHNYAWNALVYGAKKWVLYPPHDRVLSNRQILQYIKEGDMDSIAQKGARMLTCVQTAGDILVVPESWGHGVLNIQQSVAVATEAIAYLWRQQPSTRTGKILQLVR